MRIARPADAGRLAELHLTAWRWAYRHLLPPALLAGLDQDRQQRLYERRLQDRSIRIWVAEPRAETLPEAPLQGFVTTGPGRDGETLEGSGELYALYLREAATGQGMGRRLVEAALEERQSAGWSSAYLWVLADNLRARGFYAATGWREDGGVRVDATTGLAAVRYGRVLGAQRQ